MAMCIFLRSVSIALVGFSKRSVISKSSWTIGKYKQIDSRQTGRRLGQLWRVWNQEPELRDRKRILSEKSSLEGRVKQRLGLGQMACYSTISKDPWKGRTQWLRGTMRDFTHLRGCEPCGSQGSSKSCWTVRPILQEDWQTDGRHLTGSHSPQLQSSSQLPPLIGHCPSIPCLPFFPISTGTAY